MSDPTAPLPPFDGEVLGPPPGSSASSGGGGRRFAIVGVIAGLVAVLLGGAAFAAYQFLNGGGPRPEDALPASTLAAISVDLDPRAGQKIEAFKTIRKFPALKESLGGEDDLRKLVFDEVLKDGDCDHVDYADDIKPWIGKRGAFGVVDLGGDEVAPTIALQVEDRAEAKTGMAEVVACMGADDFFFALGEDYLIASDSQEHAEAILAAGKKKSLADDEAYQKWTDKVGDQGVLSFYVSSKAADYFADELEGLFSEMTGGDDYAGEGSAGAAAPMRRDADDPADIFGDALSSFQGMAGTVRFADGGMELAVVTGGVMDAGGKDAPAVGDEVGALPKDTALAVGYGIPDDFTDQVLEYVGDDPEFQDFLDEAEDRTGLDLPEDVQTLLGDAITLSLGSDAPEHFDERTGPQDIPLGLVLHTDPEKAEEIIETAEDGLGTSLSDLPVFTEKTASTLVLSTSEDYAEELTKKGTLGETAAFRDAVPEADDADAIIFATLTADWRRAIAELAASDLTASEVDELEENLSPLRAVGLSTKADGKDGVFKLRISTR